MLAVPKFSFESYWSEFDLDDQDLDVIYNLLLEREVPLTTPEMVGDLISHRLQRAQQEAEKAAETEHESYRPADRYEVGQTLIFPALGNKTGSVVKVRAGSNPDLGGFDVIEIAFDNDDLTKEFAAGLEEHVLNRPPETDGAEEALTTVEGVREAFGARIADRLEARLEQADEIIRIAGRWFHKALVADIHEGQLNLVEAVLDVAEGGPLPTSDFLEHIEPPGGIDPRLMTFSLDYALQEDERFDEVGPAGQVLWFLKRLEPPEVLYTPPRLEPNHPAIDRSVLSEDLLALERKLDDELSPHSDQVEVDDEVTLSLLFPHWRVGALPLSTRLLPLFPTAYEAPRIRFILVDGHSGDKFPGWVVRKAGYVFGLDEWFKRYEVMAGGLIKVNRGEREGEVIVRTLDRRRMNDWIRTTTIDDSGEIGFTMLKQSVGSAYDDLMVVSIVDPIALDEAWLQGKQRQLPIDRLVAQVFRELAKLTPQSAVHAQSLYSGVNVIRRLPPDVVFYELATRPYYVHVGDLYWRFEPEAWGNA